MNNIRKALADALAAPEAPIVNVVFSSSMESANIDVLSMESFGFNELSMETQQMEDHLTKLVDHKIEQILQPVPKPTAPTAFVVSRKGLTDGVISDQEVVRAAVQAKLEEPNDDIVLAVLPEEATTGSEEPDEHVESIRQFAAGADVPVVESMEALKEFLDSATLSTEGFLDSVFKGMAWIADRFKKKTINDRLSTYSNKTKMLSLEYREGLVNSAGIINRLHVYDSDALPPDPAKAVQTALQSALDECQRVKKAISTKPNAVAQCDFDARVMLGGAFVDDGGDSVRYNNSGVFSKGDPAARIPALTAQQAADLGKILSEFVSKYWKFHASCFTRGGDHDDFTFPVDQAPNRSVWYSFFHDANQMPAMFYDIFDACDLWIQRSVKRVSLESLDDSSISLESTGTVEEKVIWRTSKISGEPQNDITVSTQLRKDCGMDNIDILDLIMDLEEVFGVELGRDVKKFRTVKDLITAVNKAI